MACGDIRVACDGSREGNFAVGNIATWESYRKDILPKGKFAVRKFRGKETLLFINFAVSKF